MTKVQRIILNVAEAGGAAGCFILGSSFGALGAFVAGMGFLWVWLAVEDWAASLEATDA